MLSTAVWILLVSSSILGYYAHHLDDPPIPGQYIPTAGLARWIARFADLLRWIGKLLAIINGIGIVANSVFQYAGVYDNCYCNASLYYWGSSYAFNVISPIQSDINLARKAWIGALVLALSCCTFSVGTIYLIRDSLPP